MSASAQAGPTAAAFAEAKRTGRGVLLSAMTDATTVVYAQPDGTYQAKVSAEPVRFHGADGWTDIDTTLVAGPDGTVRPRSVEAPLTFGGAGTRTLVVTRRQGVEFTWFSPFGALPAPVLSGQTATYPEVAPGVDLVVQALGEGFAEYVVVKDATAAALPQVRTLRFPWSVSGGRDVRQGAEAFTVSDAGGATAFRGSRALMWSGAGKTPGAAPRTTVDGFSLARLAPSGLSIVTPLAMSAEREGLSLTAPTSALRGQGVTYPLVIDPSVVSPGVAHRAMVDNSNPDVKYYDWNDADQGIGYQNYDGENTKRLFWMFAMPSTFFTNVTGARTVVSSASLTVLETYASSCTATPVEAWLTDTINANTTWNAQPQWKQRLASKTVSYGRDGCETATNVSAVDTNVEFSVGAGMQAAADGRWSYATLALKAASETDPLGHKRFAKNATLTVNFNHTPNPPVAMTGPGGACTSTAEPTSPGSFRMSATLADGDPGDTLTGTFAVYNATNNARVAYFTKGPAAQGSFFADVTNLAAGQYYWQVTSADKTSSVAGPKCRFAVDATPPPSPTISIGLLRLVDDDGDASTPAALPVTVGVPVNLSVLMLSSPSDVVRFRWSINSDLPLSASLTGPSRAFFSPTFNSSGISVLRAWAYDAAGNQSAPTDLRVVASTGLPARWSLDVAGTSAPSDASCLSAMPALTWYGTSSLVQGASYSLKPTEATAANVDRGRELTGSGFGAAQSAALLPTSTNERASYSASLWTRLAATGVINDDGTFVGTTPRTLLTLDSSTTQLALTVTLEPGADSYPVVTARAYSPTGQVVAVSLARLDFTAWRSYWSYVTVAVSAELGLSLQIDQTAALFAGSVATAKGKFVNAAPWPAGFAPSPPVAWLRLGSGQTTTATPTKPWLGALDELRVFRAPLIPDWLDRPALDLAVSSIAEDWFGRIPPFSSGSPCLV